MKAKIEFDLDEELYEYGIYNNAMGMKASIDNFYDTLRNLYKYNQPNLDNKDDTVDYLREQFVAEFSEFLE